MKESQKDHRIHRVGWAEYNRLKDELVRLGYPPVLMEHISCRAYSIFVAYTFHEMKKIAEDNINKLTELQRNCGGKTLHEIALALIKIHIKPKVIQLTKVRVDWDESCMSYSTKTHQWYIFKNKKVSKRKELIDMTRVKKIPLTIYITPDELKTLKITLEEEIDRNGKEYPEINQRCRNILKQLKPHSDEKKEQSQ